MIYKTDKKIVIRVPIPEGADVSTRNARKRLRVATKDAIIEALTTPADLQELPEGAEQPIGLLPKPIPPMIVEIDPDEWPEGYPPIIKDDPDGG